MKKQRKIEKDNRGVAIYARKSRITNKGDSIGVQFKQCADYAKKELGLDEEYEFLQYEDKGLSGYFSDRPDFQRMLHDVQDGKNQSNRMLQTGSCRQKNSRSNPPDGFLGNVPC